MHLVGAVVGPAAFDVVDRKWATGPRDGFVPFAADDDGVPVMARPGDGYRSHVTGLTHAENGFPTQDPEVVDRMLRRLLNKVERHRDAIESYETLTCDDAEIVVVAYGITARAARRAVNLARQGGIKAGLFRPITLWPFPEKAFLTVGAGARSVLVPEMNAGQLSLEVERLCSERGKTSSLGRVDGEAIEPDEILAKIEGLANHG